MIYLKLFYEFFKIGLFTFGGGYAMIPLVRDTAINSGWLLADEFSSLIAVCESTPGPVAINMATYIGSLQGRLADGTFGGVLGSACATLGVVLPSFIIILLIASLLNKLTENKHFKNFIRGVKPVVTALILSTGLLLLVECIGINIDVKEIDVNLVSIIVFGIVAVLYYIVLKVFKKKISSIQIILLAAVLGIGLSYLLA